MKYARERKKRNPLILLLEIALVAAAVVFCIYMINGWLDAGVNPPDPLGSTTTAAPDETTAPAPTEPQTPEQIIRAFAEQNGLSYWDYPVKVVEMLEKNPETEDFVLNYVTNYGKVEEEHDLSDFADVEGVPLFMQWDTRWGFMEYGADALGFTGCGPTSLAMVAYYYTKDPNMTPDKVAQFAIDNGYCAYGNGSYWTLISEGGRKLGLNVTEIPLDKDRMIRNLQAGNPIICIMGKGVFTTSGHFIVLVGYEDGKFLVNDCNSYANSEKAWDYEEFSDQIGNLWVIQAGS